MAQCIEDPQIASLIDEMKSRWPDIGAAADHPLTEWFVQWTRKTSEPPHAAADEKIMNHNRWEGNLISSKRLPRHTLRSEDDLLRDMGDVGQWEQFCLAPLDYRDIAGIAIGCDYCRFHALYDSKLSTDQILVASSPFAGAILYYLSTFKDLYHAGWPPVGWIVIFVGLLAMCATFFATSLKIRMREAVIDELANLEKCLQNETVTWRRINHLFKIVPDLRGTVRLSGANMFGSLAFLFIAGLLVSCYMASIVYVSAASYLSALINWYLFGKQAEVDLNERFKQHVENQRPCYEAHMNKILGRS